MADVGDFEDVPCSCPSPAGTPHIGTGAPGPTDVGDFDYVSCCPIVVIESPDAGPIDGLAVLVYHVIATEGVIEGTEATITDASGAAYVVFSTADGFAPGFTGSVDGIDHGVRVTINPSVAWPPGPLHLHVHVQDSDGGQSTGDRGWTVVAGASGDLIDQAKARVITEYRNSPKLLLTIETHAILAQQLKDGLLAIPPLDDNSQAGGVNLDVNGEIVGQARQLSDGNIASDGQYRVLQGARATRNHARVGGDDLVTYLTTFFGAPVILDDHGGMAIDYTVLREPTDDEIAVLNDDIVARPMGVKVTRVWAATGYFGFSNDPNALGFSDHTGTTGGVLAREF